MGHTKRIATDQSCKSFAENFKQSLKGFLIFILMLLSSCSTKDHYVPTQTKTQFDDNIEVLTKVGRNESVRVSKDGQKILFLGSQKPLHRQAQVYEMNLRTKEERRLLYQSGTVLEPVYDPTEKNILFLSTTDEEKEFPTVLHPKKYQSSWPQTEVYAFNLKDQESKRLTNYDGFDGSISFYGNKVVGLREKQKGMEFWELFPNGQRLLDVVPSAKLPEKLESLQYSNSLKRWLALASEHLYQTAQLKEPFTLMRELETPNSVILKIRENDKGLLVLIRDQVTEKKVIALLKLQNKELCKQEIWSHDKAPVIDFDWHSASEKLFLTLEINGLREIYSTPTQSTKNSCQSLKQAGA